MLNRQWNVNQMLNIYHTVIKDCMLVDDAQSDVGFTPIGKLPYHIKSVVRYMAPWNILREL